MSSNCLAQSEFTDEALKRASVEEGTQRDLLHDEQKSSGARRRRTTKKLEPERARMMRTHVLMMKRP